MLLDLLGDRASKADTTRICVGTAADIIHIHSRLIHPLYTYDGSEEEGYERKAATEG